MASRLGVVENLVVKGAHCFVPISCRETRCPLPWDGCSVGCSGSSRHQVLHDFIHACSASLGLQGSGVGGADALHGGRGDARQGEDVQGCRRLVSGWGPSGPVPPELLRRWWWPLGVGLLRPSVALERLMVASKAGVAALHHRLLRDLHGFGSGLAGLTLGQQRDGLTCLALS